MKSKIQLVAVLIGACLTSGCIVPGPYPGSYYGGPAYYGVPGEAAFEPDYFVEPDVVIVEGGVRHDRYFYHRHPEFYRRDQARYPERFARSSHSSRHEMVQSRNRVSGPHTTVVSHGVKPSDAHQANLKQDPRDLKKKRKYQDDQTH